MTYPHRVQPVVVVQRTYALPAGWTPPPQRWAQPPRPPALAAQSSYLGRLSRGAEPTVIDPGGTESARPLPPSPWGFGHQR